MEPGEYSRAGIAEVVCVALICGFVWLLNAPCPSSNKQGYERGVMER